VQAPVAKRATEPEIAQKKGFIFWQIVVPH